MFQDEGSDSSTNPGYTLKFEPFTCAHEICCRDVAYTYTTARDPESLQEVDESKVATPTFNEATGRMESGVSTASEEQHSFWIYAKNNYDESANFYAFSAKITVDIRAAVEIIEVPPQVNDFGEAEGKMEQTAVFSNEIFETYEIKGCKYTSNLEFNSKCEVEKIFSKLIFA